jgi:lipoic acid synthetase
MNHNLETVPRLYKEARPGADYLHSLQLLRDFKERYPGTVTKSGLMVGLGETDEEILQVMRDMREHKIDMLTIGQYLQPSEGHLPVRRYVHPDGFKMFEEETFCARIRPKAIRERVKYERAAQRNLGPADSGGNRISQGKPSLPEKGPAGPFSFSSPVLASLF